MTGEFAMASSVLRKVFSSPLLRGHYEKEESLIPFKYEGSEQEQKRLISLVNKIAAHSETGKAVLQKAAENGYTLSFGMQKDSYGYAEPKGKRLVLNPKFNDASLLNTLVHESRHAEQFAHGAEQDFGKLTLRSEIMEFRAAEADACAVAALAMLEAEKNGLTMKDKLRIGASYETRKLFNGNADKKDVLRAAFDSWFEDRGRKEAYEDGYIIQPMKNGLKKKAEKKMTYSTAVSSAQIIDQICTTPDGCYFSDKNALDDAKYLDISAGTKEVADRFFALREKRTGMKPDTSYADLPVRQGYSMIHGTFHGVCYDKTPSPSKLPMILAQKQKSR